MDTENEAPRQIPSEVCIAEVIQNKKAGVDISGLKLPLHNMKDHPISKLTGRGKEN